MWIALLHLHLLLFGLAALTNRRIGHFSLARIWTPVLLVLAAFFVEHFAGLGALQWLGAIGALAGGIVLYRERRSLASGIDRGFEITYAAAFLYVFLWRYSFPDLHGDSSERLTDLSFIVNYSRGLRLPPPDSWLPPHSFGMYYAFQHYAAALMGRILAVEPGVAYHFAYSAVIALASAAGYLVVSHFTRRRWHIWLVLTAVLLGGTGASVVVNAIKPNGIPFDSSRFIGYVATEKVATRPFGEWLVRIAGVPSDGAIQLPIETLGYLIVQGDYHPPLGGFLLLAAALASIVLIERPQNKSKSLRFFAQAMLAASVPLSMATNTWITPLQAMLAAGWIVYRLATRQEIGWRAIIAGGGGASILLSPFLYHFLSSTSGQNMSLRWVPAGLHTPPLLGLILLAPALIVLAIQTLRRDAAPLARAGAAFFALCFLFTEFVFADDRYIQHLERFNSTAKWWGWIWCGVFLFAAPDALQAASRAIRIAAICALLAPCVYLYDLAGAFVRTPKIHAGVIEGWGALLDDPLHRKAFEYLKPRPPATVLQLVEADYYTVAPSLVIFSGHNAFIGWTEHERTWRSNSPIIYQRESQTRQFYLGLLPNAAQWLRDNGIQHVLWLPTLRRLPADAFDSISTALRGSPYRWKEFLRTDHGVYGVWSID